MPGKSTRRVSRKKQAEVQAIAADGIMANAIDRIFENPAMSGGLVVMVITAMAIMSNALFLQRGQHPEPLFATRPASFADAPAPAPIATRRAAVPETTTEPMPTPIPVPRTREHTAVTVAPAAPATIAEPPAPAPNSAAALITSIQRELARLGLYTGSIDGLIGPQTRAAIAKWQNAAGIPATGEPTPELLLALQKPTASIAPAPVQPVVSVDRDAVAAAVERAEQLEREQAAVEEAQSLRRVQVALSEMGYGPLRTDGRMDRATADALRGFQLDNGLSVTGANSDALMKRLVSIGAMKAD